MVKPVSLDAEALAGSAALACPVIPVRRPDWAIIVVSLTVAVVARGLLPAAHRRRIRRCRRDRRPARPASAGRQDHTRCRADRHHNATHLHRRRTAGGHNHPPPLSPHRSSPVIELSRIAYASSLLENHPASSGYLLKERVHAVAVLDDALRRVQAGECVIDPAFISQLLSRHRKHGPLDEPTDREREILGLISPKNTQLQAPVGSHPA